MMLDHISSKAVVPDRSSSPGALSRRGFLQAAAVGGGLMLSLQLPFVEHDAQAADADLRESFAGRAGNRQLECDPRILAAPAPSRRDRQNHVGRRCRKKMECRARVLSRGKR